MTATQLLGAFNDNLFKQLVLLYCLTAVGKQGGDYQPIAFFCSRSRSCSVRGFPASWPIGTASGR